MRRNKYLSTIESMDPEDLAKQGFGHISTARSIKHKYDHVQKHVHNKKTKHHKKVS